MHAHARARTHARAHARAHTHTHTAGEIEPRGAWRGLRSVSNHQQSLIGRQSLLDERSLIGQQWLGLLGERSPTGNRSRMGECALVLEHSRIVGNRVIVRQSLIGSRQWASAH